MGKCYFCELHAINHFSRGAGRLYECDNCGMYEISGMYFLEFQTIIANIDKDNLMAIGKKLNELYAEKGEPYIFLSGGLEKILSELSQ